MKHYIEVSTLGAHAIISALRISITAMEEMDVDRYIELIDESYDIIDHIREVLRNDRY